MISFAMRDSSTSNARCTPEPRARTTLSLPVLKSASTGHSTIARSKAGKWRAASLILVHILIAAHIIQWWVMGMTLSPVEPSESMHTLRTGVVNTGFVFFALAILSTAIFGRYFCGWACHIIAIQDLCSWLMNKLGVKPKPFRSRLLIFVPLILALYMFVWPVVHREVLRPVFADAQGRLPVWLGQSEPLPGLSTEFLVEDFWATFAPWYIAIPFTLVCTFGAVYFLGSKGFCTYGCPYGGLFGPADRIAPGRIRVTNACEHCGHCTAVCTSNVRVHEEVRDFGMVVDPGCMKCLDCVTVCPNDALYFGFGAPSLVARPREGAKETAAQAKALREARYDLSRTEEWMVGLLFLVLFLCYRGMYNTVPMLMAVGMAGIVSFAAWKSWRLFRDPNARLQSIQLKLKGTLKPAGYAFILGTFVLLALAGWSGFVRSHLWLAELNYARLDTPIDVITRPDFEPSAGEFGRAQAALRHYAIADAPESGGFGWAVRPDDLMNIAYMRLLVGDSAGAEAALKQVIQRGRPRDAVIQQLVSLMARRGASADDLRATMRDALALHPTLEQTRDQLARDLAQNGKASDAVALWNEGLQALPHRPSAANARLTAAAFFLDHNDRPRAETLLAEALSHADHAPDVTLGAARMRAAIDGPQKREPALALANSAAEQARENASRQLAAAGLLGQLGESEKALMHALRGVERSQKRGRHTGQANLFTQAGMMHMSAGKTAEGMKLLRAAAEAVDGRPWEQAALGVSFVNVAAQANNPDLFALGIGLLEKARDGRPEAPTIRHDLAVAYGMSGRLDDAERELRKAAELSPRSPDLALRLAQMLRERGKGDEADKWMKEAQRREQARAAGKGG